MPDLGVQGWALEAFRTVPDSLSESMSDNPAIIPTRLRPPFQNNTPTSLHRKTKEKGALSHRLETLQAPG